MRKYVIFFVIDFLVGILLAQIIGEKQLICIEYFQRYRLELFSKQNLNNSFLFWKVIWDRTKIFSWLVLFSMTRYREYLLPIACGFCVFALGFFHGAYVLCFGISGILLVFSATFPQLFIYLFDVYLIERRMDYVSLRTSYYRKAKLGHIAITVLVFLAGCVTETLVGTRFFQWVIRLVL